MKADEEKERDAGVNPKSMTRLGSILKRERGRGIQRYPIGRRVPTPASTASQITNTDPKQPITRGFTNFLEPAVLSPVNFTETTRSDCHQRPPGVEEFTRVDSARPRNSFAKIDCNANVLFSFSFSFSRSQNRWIYFAMEGKTRHSPFSTHSLTQSRTVDPSLTYFWKTGETEKSLMWL